MRGRTQTTCELWTNRAMADILPDLLDHDLILVFCGTAASQVSARAGAYYANPGNRFWTALWQTGITAHRYAPGDFRGLLRLRIGLTDLVKDRAGNDSQLRQADYQAESLRQKIAVFQPRIVAFTSKTAWRAWAGLKARDPVDYGWQGQRLNGTRFFTLPSPSGAARGYWRIQPWHELARAYHALMAAARGQTCASIAAGS